MVREWMLLPDGKFHVVFFDVGQGDSALLTLPRGTQILIDGGPDWSALERLGRYMPFFDRDIDVLILSHPNLDHLAAFPEVLRRYRVQTLFIAGSVYDVGTYQALLHQAQTRGTAVVRLHAGQSLQLPDDLMMDVLWPPERMPAGFNANINNESLVLRMTYDGRRMLFTGDIEKIVEDTLTAAKADLKTDIVKVAHHGSKSSSSTGFLLAADPDLAVVSVSARNTYGHPSAAVLGRLEAMGIEIRRTDMEGDIEIMW